MSAGCKSILLKDEDGEYRITPQQYIFVNTYIANGYKLKKAFDVAYPNDNQGAKHTFQVFHKPNVQRYLIQRQKEILDDFDISPERTFGEIARIAYAPVTDEIHYKEKMEMLKLLVRAMEVSGQLKPDDDSQTIIIKLEGDGE